MSNVGDPNLLDVFELGESKFNKNISYHKGDNFSKTKVLCKETYAQELYDRYVQHFDDFSDSLSSKDLVLNAKYLVEVVGINYTDKLIKTEIKNTGIPVFVPFSEYHLDKSNLEDAVFEVIVYANYRGVYYGSHKKYAKKGYLKEVEVAFAKKDWFYVDVIELVDGGYIVEYKKTVRCFLPGGQAVPNIIKDFNDLVGKSIPVVVDNYDPMGKLYIVSHKKYIKKMLPYKINDLKFGVPYKGMLTSNPTKFGLFIEIDNFFTGLLHKTEIDDYDTVSRTMRAFDTMDVYIKDILYDRFKKSYKIILTNKKENVNKNKYLFDYIKSNFQNIITDYTFSEKDSTIGIISKENKIVYFPVDSNYVMKYVHSGYKHIVIKNVDVIKERIYFDFIA